MLNCNLYVNHSAPNVANKALSDETSVEILLKDDTKIENPVIKIRKTDTIEKAVHDFNYLYIPKFDRYYFIEKRVSLNATVWQLECKVDVLSSFLPELKELNAIIERSNKFFNTYITDDSYTVQNRTRVQTKTFPNGFGTDSLLLVVAG